MGVGEEGRAPGVRHRSARARAAVASPDASAPACRRPPRVLPHAERRPLPAPARPLQHDPLQHHAHAALTMRRSTWPGMVAAVRHAA